MKTDLVTIVNRKTLSPRSGYRSNDDIIPAVIDPSRVCAAPGTAMKDETPEVIRIKAATDKPEALKRCQAVPIHIKANDRRQSPANTL